MKQSLLSWSWTNQLFASGGVAVAGGVGTAAGSFFDFQCPLASVGLACAGCGCSRAVTIAVSDGLGSALSAQPTALIFVLVLTLSLLISAIHVIRSTTTLTLGFITPLVVAACVVVAAVLNFGYQLNTNV